VTQSDETTKQTTTNTTLTFHWNYIIAPVVVFILSIILIGYFYQRLPVEVAYHFTSDGSPDRWLSRGTIILWALLPQLLLTLLAAGLSWGITRLSSAFRQPQTIGTKAERVLSLMGNMIALPQAIHFFAMLDIFSYNAFQIHLLPLWVVAVIIMGVGGIVLGVFFIRAIRQVLGDTR